MELWENCKLVYRKFCDGRTEVGSRMLMQMNEVWRVGEDT